MRLNVCIGFDPEPGSNLASEIICYADFTNTTGTTLKSVIDQSPEAAAAIQQEMGITLGFETNEDGDVDIIILEGPQEDKDDPVMVVEDIRDQFIDALAPLGFVFVEKGLVCREFVDEESMFPVSSPSKYLN